MRRSLAVFTWVLMVTWWYSGLELEEGIESGWVSEKWRCFFLNVAWFRWTSFRTRQFLRPRSENSPWKKHQTNEHESYAAPVQSLQLPRPFRSSIGSWETVQMNSGRWNKKNFSLLMTFPVACWSRRNNLLGFSSCFSSIFNFSAPKIPTTTSFKKQNQWL